MSYQRAIDADERSRKKPMRVLVLGMCRTGTSSIAAALRKLGYTPHHMRLVLSTPSDIPLWQEAVSVTLTPPSERQPIQRMQEPYGRAEFDKLLGDYDAVTDLPGVAFANELVEAYPEAKVILTNRPYAEWEQSMQASIWNLFTWRLFNWCRLLTITQMAPLMWLLHSIFRVHNGNHYGGPEAKEGYDAHYANVRKSVPKGRLLEFGPDFRWEPLCAFLGHDVPKESFPLMDESKVMHDQLLRAWWGMVQYLVLMVVMPGSVVVLGVLSFYWRELIVDWFQAGLMRFEPLVQGGFGFNLTGDDEDDLLDVALLRDPSVLHLRDLPRDEVPEESRWAAGLVRTIDTLHRKNKKLAAQHAADTEMRKYTHLKNVNTLSWDCQRAEQALKEMEAVHADEIRGLTRRHESEVAHVREVACSDINSATFKVTADLQKDTSAVRSREREVSAAEDRLRALQGDHEHVELLRKRIEGLATIESWNEHQTSQRDHIARQAKTAMDTAAGTGNNTRPDKKSSSDMKGKGKSQAPTVSAAECKEPSKLKGIGSKHTQTDATGDVTRAERKEPSKLKGIGSKHTQTDATGDVTRAECKEPSELKGMSRHTATGDVTRADHEAAIHQALEAGAVIILAQVMQWIAAYELFLEKNLSAADAQGRWVSIDNQDVPWHPMQAGSNAGYMTQKVLLCKEHGLPHVGVRLVPLNADVFNPPIPKEGKSLPMAFKHWFAALGYGAEQARMEFEASLAVKTTAAEPEAGPSTGTVALEEVIGSWTLLEKG
ncbi:hypothetical protein BDV95DRAFT_607649 [Massariosphaeria phaeospora]|uniref:P-loop containing nucleoside triphosphate hydrolase protein n=1 Tax=Massariosphaeria phaeospora TaxID=100035 RepID=A0A7C8M737_9PLEO|nr:hypothetical protein BDV95DRAFT_607649 [Massariosphaeria phaeospora]